MLSFQTILFALLAVPATLAAPHGNPIARAAAQSYSGPASSFPKMSTWADYDTIVSARQRVNEQVSSLRCANTHILRKLSKNTPSMIAAGSTKDDVKNIGTAVKSVASSQGIDPRVILSLIMQESTGYVGVATTTNVDGQGTGGLMQTSGCAGYPGQSGLTAVSSYLLIFTSTRRTTGRDGMAGRPRLMGIVRHRTKLRRW